jgi:hypothetical protein
MQNTLTVSYGTFALENTQEVIELALIELTELVPHDRLRVLPQEVNLVDALTRVILILISVILLGKPTCPRNHLFRHVIKDVDTLDYVINQVFNTPRQRDLADSLKEIISEQTIQLLRNLSTTLDEVVLANTHAVGCLLDAKRLGHISQALSKNELLGITIRGKLTFKDEIHHFAEKVSGDRVVVLLNDPRQLSKKISSTLRH